MFSSVIFVTWASPFFSFFPSLSFAFLLLVSSPENILTCQVFFLQTAEAANCNPIAETQTCPSSIVYHSCLSPAVNELSHTEEGVVCKPSFHQNAYNAVLTARNLSQSSLKIKGMKNYPVFVTWAGSGLQMTPGNRGWLYRMGLDAMCSDSPKPGTVYLLCPWCSTESPSSKTHLSAICQKVNNTLWITCGFFLRGRRNILPGEERNTLA